MRRGGLAAALARGAVSSERKSSSERRPPPTSSIVPTSDADHVAHEGVGLDLEELRMPGTSPHQAAARTSRSKRTWSVSVGVKAVKSWAAGERGGAGVERLAVDPVAPPEGPALLERVRVRRWRGSGSGRRASGRRGGRRIRGGAASQARTRRRSGAPRSGSARAPPAPPPPRSSPPARSRGRRRRCGPATVSGTSAPRMRSERRLELALDRALAGLRGPAAEPGSVVGDLEPVAGQARQTSSRKTISVESERRGPSLTIRV